MITIADILDKKPFIPPVATTEELAYFEFLPDSILNTYLDKVHFENIEQIPVCKKYCYVSPVKFVRGYLAADIKSNKQDVISIDIHALVSLYPQHYLSLHPIRYDTVKRAICKGEIDMPLLNINDEGVVVADNGRHRLIALLKFGQLRANVLVPKQLTECVSKQLEIELLKNM